MSLSTKVGSPLMYKAPEAYNLRGTVEGKPCDMWAFGVMAIEILADFYLSNNLPQIENGWLMYVHHTLNEILQEQVFKKYFDGTFLKNEKNGDLDARMALDFVHGFLKMDPSERVTSSEAKQHPFLNGGSDVVNVPDDIWNNELYIGASEFDDSFCSFEVEIGFSNEDASNEGNDFLNMALDNFNPSENENKKTFGTHILVSRHSPDNFADLKYEFEVPESDSETSQTASKVRVRSETTFEFESTNTNANEHKIPLSEQIRNLRLRIKQLIENCGNITDENVPKAEPITDEVYIQREDVGLESRTAKDFHECLEKNSLFSVEDCATGCKATSMDATLEFVKAIKSLLKRLEDYKGKNFQSIDVSSKECKEEILKINLVGHNSDEANMPVDSTSSTVLETRGRRKRFIGWLQSKCLSALKLCFPCMTEQNSSRNA